MYRTCPFSDKYTTTVRALVAASDSPNEWLPVCSVHRDENVIKVIGSARAGSLQPRKSMVLKTTEDTMGKSIRSRLAPATHLSEVTSAEDSERTCASLLTTMGCRPKTGRCFATGTRCKPRGVTKYRPDLT